MEKEQTQTKRNHQSKEEEATRKEAKMKEQQAQAKRSHQRKEEEATQNRFMGGFCSPSSHLQAGLGGVGGGWGGLGGIGGVGGGAQPPHLQTQRRYHGF